MGKNACEAKNGWRKEEIAKSTGNEAAVPVFNIRNVFELPCANFGVQLSKALAWTPERSGDLLGHGSDAIGPLLNVSSTITRFCF